MGIFSRDDAARSTDGRSTSRTTADVAVTGQPRDLDLSDADREHGRVTDQTIRDLSR